MNTDDNQTTPSNSSSHYTRSKALTQFKFAGVLPFCILQNGETHVLLGAEPVRTGPSGCIWKTMWRDFGGSRESIDIDAEATAAREFAEETLGVFASMEVNACAVAQSSEFMAHQLRARTHALEIKRPLKQGYYSMFITMLPHLDPMMFYLATQQNAQTQAVAGAEKTAFAWVNLEDLVRATAPRLGRYFLRATVTVSGPADQKQPVLRGYRCMQLHPCFASTIRAAQGAGLPELIARARTECLATSLPVPQNTFHQSRRSIASSLQARKDLEPKLSSNGEEGPKVSQLPCVGAFRLAGAALVEQPSRAAPLAGRAGGCRGSTSVAASAARSADSREERPAQQGSSTSGSYERENQHVSVTGAGTMDSSKLCVIGQSDMAGCLQEQQLPLQDKQHCLPNSRAVLAEKPCPSHSPASIPEQALTVQTGTKPQGCRAEGKGMQTADFDMSPAWRQAIQSLADTGLSVFSDSKRRRVSVQL